MNKFILIPPKRIGLNDYSDFCPDYFEHTLILKRDDRCSVREQWIDWSKGYNKDIDNAGGLSGHYLKYSRYRNYVEFDTFEEAKELADKFDLEYNKFRKGEINWPSLSFNDCGEQWMNK